MRTDHELQRDIIAELEWQPSLRNEEIGVAVKDGVVTLSGNVANYARKFDAEQAVEKVHGVKAVAVDLTVKMQNSFIRSDSDIAHAAIQALKWDLDVPDEKVKLRVEDGRVILEGEVELQYQRAAAMRAIRYLSGVKSVSNLLSVKPSKTSAADVSKMIGAAFKRSADRRFQPDYRGIEGRCRHAQWKRTFVGRASRRRDRGVGSTGSDAG